MTKSRWIRWVIQSADKSLARPGRKQARKHARDARDFNNIESRAVIKFLFFARQAAEGNSRHSDRNVSLFPSWSDLGLNQHPCSLWTEVSCFKTFRFTASAYKAPQTAANKHCRCVWIWLCTALFLFSFFLSFGTGIIFLILAHTAYKMWITQEPNTLELWNKLHFEEKKNGECIPCLKYSVPIFVE